MKRLRTYIFVLLWVVAPSVMWAGEADWTVVEKEAGDLLSRYLQIDTTNPPGNEITAAHFWQQLLSDEGIEAQVFESQPGRGVVYARLKGSGEKKAIILLHHLDVVPAVKADWSVDPFAGTIQYAYVYGRGAIDCKGVAVAQFMALALLKRAGIPLKRDIIFLGTADEEAGGVMVLAGSWISISPSLLMQSFCSPKVGISVFKMNNGGTTLILLKKRQVGFNYSDFHSSGKT